MKPKKPTIGAVTKKQVMKQTSKVKPPLSAAGAAKKRKQTAMKIGGMAATAVGAVADMVNTKRRLTGKSYLGNKKRP
jgi:hypothetical protein